MLTEQHRSKLDSIVSQMEANGEDSSAISAVVEDYKSKYEGAAEQEIQAAAADQPGFTQRFLEHNALTAPFAHPMELVKDATALATGASGDLAADPLAFEPSHIAGRAIGQLAKDAYQGASAASQNQFEKMFQDSAALPADASMRDIISQPLKQQLHMQLGVLGAFPFTSGIANAESEFENPVSRAGGLGGLVGEASNFLLPALGKATKSGIGKAGVALEENAITRYDNALRPKKRFEGLSRDVAKKSIDRGIWGTEKGLNKLTDGAVRDLGAQIEAVYSNSDKTLDVGEASRSPLAAIEAEHTFGGIQEAPTIEAASQGLLERNIQRGSLPVIEAWRLAQELEAPAAQKGVYLPGVDPSLVAKAEVGEAVASKGIRPALAELEPSLKPVSEGGLGLNENYSYYAKLKKLLNNSRSPRAPLSGKDLASLAKRQGIGALVGGVIGGGPVGAAIGSVAAEVGRAITNSTAFKTGSAVLQSKIAKLLQEGNVPEATQTFIRAGGSVAELPRLKDEAR